MTHTAVRLVLGLGESGRAMVQWLERCGACVRSADSRTAPFTLSLLEGVELLCVSPGLSLTEPIVVEAGRRNIPIVGEIELFARALRDLNLRDTTQILAITGTNGKTTVTSLVGAMCRAAGKRTAVAGNISPSVLTALMQHLDGNNIPEIWVLELSSFQLETTVSLAPDAATVLNISDDHLDRYVDIEDYAQTKARIFLGSGVQILNREDARVMRMAEAVQELVKEQCFLTFGLNEPSHGDEFGLSVHQSELWLAQGDSRLMPVKELQLTGLHNAANALAALALCRAIGLPFGPLCEGLRAFKGLPHRVEKVADIGGVSYYDDSKGTNVGATVAALKGMGQKVVLIAGGDGKGQDFTPLSSALKKYARALILIGRDADLIEAAVPDCNVPVLHAKDLQQALMSASALARQGDVVLLSPACASFDMFQDYTHRAQVFIEAVHALAKAHSEHNKLDKESA